MRPHHNTIMIIAYFTLLLLLAPIHMPSFDTFYYWDWSRHLALSYYDGSPMIAYFIKLSTLIFGDTLFAFNIVGIVCAAFTSWILYKTARLFLSKEASFVAMCLWLCSPLTTLTILQQTTYDTPLLLFWAMTLYYVIKLVQFNQIKDLYFAGISIGLMLLSKYSGIVLVFALFIFLFTKPLRHLLKNRHFYCMLLIPLILFSPVILWNQQHQWQSFLYQLATHQLEHANHPAWNVMQSFFCIFLPSLNFMFIPPVLCWLKRSTTKSNIVRLCGLIGLTLIAFYLLVASHAEIKGNWLAPYLLTSALLAGYCFQAFHYRKTTFLLVGAYAIASVGIFINSTFPLFTLPKKHIYYQLIENLNAAYPKLPKTIITAGWLEARMLFFLKNKPDVYTLDCGAPQNQYALWSTDMVMQIKNKAIKEALYIDTKYRIQCVEKYFDHCVRLFPPTYIYKNHEATIYAFTCSNDDLKPRTRSKKCM